MRNVFFCFMLGCGATPNWSSYEDCQDLEMGAEGDDCWAQHAADFFRDAESESDRLAAEERIVARVEQTAVRDYIWLTITREVDPASYRYCEMIESPPLSERCRVLVSRPHLHRELLGENPPPPMRTMDRKVGPSMRGPVQGGTPPSPNGASDMVEQPETNKKSD